MVSNEADNVPSSQARFARIENRIALRRVIEDICNEAPTVEPLADPYGGRHDDQDYGRARALFYVAERLRPFLKDGF